jgi:hypothetical protein
MSDLTTLSCTELIARIESLENGLANYSGQLTKIIDGLNSDAWYRSEVEKASVLSDLCEILGIQPTQTVSITATLTVCISHEVPLDELEDFDADQLVSDQLSIDVYGGDTTLDDWSVESADWEEQ